MLFYKLSNNYFDVNQKILWMNKNFDGSDYQIYTLNVPQVLYSKEK